MATQVGNRMLFDNSKTLINQLGYDASHAVLTPSYLRSEVLLSTSSASYHVPVLINDNTNGTPLTRERRLNLQDFFVVGSIQVLLTSGATGASKSYTYPNLTAFSTGAAQLWNVYTGYLNIQVNNQNVLPQWDLLQNYDAPQTQQNTNFNAATATSPAQYTIDQFSADTFANQVFEPNLVLNGASNINASIILPAAPSALDSNTYVSIIWRGILAQNVSSVK